MWAVIKDVVQCPNLSEKLETLDPKYPEKISFLVIFQEMCIVIHREVEKKVTIVALQYLDLTVFQQQT